MRKFAAVALCIVMLLSLLACGAQDASKQDASEQGEVLGATILYAKQYYAYRVGQYSATSTYSKNVTVYDEGVTLAQLLSDAQCTALDEEFTNCWGYRIQFYDADAEKIEPAVFITVDGLLHKEDTLYRLDDAQEILDLLADTVKPTNLDAVSGS